jgi:hypothetical protein
MISIAPTHAFATNPTEDVRSIGLFDRLLGRIQQSLCALHGHDAILQYERNRMFLRCTSCGHETTGWEVAPAKTRTTVRHRAAVARAALPSGPGVLPVARKIA